MLTGITRIEGIVTDTKVNGNDRIFRIIGRKGESITYTVPFSLGHMMRGVEKGVTIIIDETISGPKSIVTYPVIEQDQFDETGIKEPQLVTV